MDQSIAKQLESLGFEIIGTGGGCTAWAKYHHGLEVLISDDASADLDGEHCSINIFDQDGLDVMTLEFKVDELPQQIQEIFKLTTKGRI